MAVTRTNQTAPHQEYKHVALEVPAADVDTDGSGNVSVTVSDLIHIEEDMVQASCEAGYKIAVQSISGNTITFIMHQSAGASSAMAAAASVTDAGIVHIHCWGY